MKRVLLVAVAVFTTHLVSAGGVSGESTPRVVAQAGCAGNIRLSTGECTHGADPSVGSDREPTDAPIPPECETDGVIGRRIQVIYARAQDVTDSYGSAAPRIREYAGVVDAVILRSAEATGGYRRIRYVHGPNCGPITVANAVMPPEGDDAMTRPEDAFDNTVAHLRRLGYNRYDRKYMVFLDAAPGYCGMGHAPAQERPDSQNFANQGTDMGITARHCWGAHTPAHELVHNLGAVRSNAPHGTQHHHCSDEWDLMCYDDTDPNKGVSYECKDVFFDNRLDCNHDDYFHTNPSSDSTLSYYWNVADNLFLISAPPAPPAPPPSTSRVGVVDTFGNCHVKEGSLGAAWTQMWGASCRQIALSGLRVAVATGSGFCYVKHGALDAGWVAVRGPQCQRIDVDGERIVVRDADGSCHAKEGPLDAPWVLLRAPLCLDVTVAGQRIATADADGNCYAKEGSLGAAWVLLRGPGCLQVSLDGSRIGARDVDGSCHAKDGLTSLWVFMRGPLCTAVVVSTTRVATRDADGTCYVKDGSLFAGWTPVRTSTCDHISISGSWIATRDTSGWCHGKSGSVGEPWVTLYGPSCAAVVVSTS